MTSRYISASSKNRDYSVVVSGNGNNVSVEMQSLVFRSGDDSHEVSFFVPFGTVYNVNNLPFVSGDSYNLSNNVELRFFDATGTHHCSFWFKLISSNICNLGSKRGISYRGKDILRLWMRNQPIYKEYNMIERRDFYDQFSSRLGFYWTNPSGNVEFKAFSSTSENWLGLIDAYHAIVDIFYTPKRRLKQMGASSGDYPNLIFDPVTKDFLEDFLIPHSPYKPSSTISAIMDILQKISSRYTVTTYSNGPNLSDQTLLVTKLGSGKTITGVSNNTEQTIEQYALTNHDPSSRRIVVLSDNSYCNTENQIDALIYKGGRREYFVRQTPLVPAWDWWNDYRLVVRSSKTLKRIPMYLSNGQINPEFPSFLTSIVLQYEESMVEDISFTMANLTNPDAPTNRMYILGRITWLWQTIMAQWSTLPSNLTSSYIINICAQDFYIKPDDPYHKYRFKRYIAIPKTDNQAFIPYIDPKNGWDHPDLRRYKNILPSLIDGKRQDIGSQYMTEKLNKTETYHIAFPVIIEAEMPNYSEFDGQGFGTTFNTYGSTIDKATPLEWRQIDAAQVDGENGFFYVSEPQDQSLYYDRGTLLAAAPQNGVYSSFTTYGGANAQPGQPTTPEDDEREAAFKMPSMQSGGVGGVSMTLDYIPFRARMRATFYYHKDESFKGSMSSYNNPIQSSSHYDIPKKNATSNEVWLCGIVTPQDINPNYRYVNLRGNDVRYGFFEDANLIWQTPEDLTDPSVGGTVRLGSPDDASDKGILQNHIYTKDCGSGKVYIILQWLHRDDRENILKKAKISLLERMEPQYSGTIETLDVLDLFLQSFLLGGSSYGMGRILYNGRYMPVSGYNITFPDFKTTVEFDLLPPRMMVPYDPYRVQRIIVAENYRRLNEKEAIVDPRMLSTGNVNQTGRKSAEAFRGMKVPWEDNRPKLFNKMPGANYGKILKNIPSGSANDAIIRTIYSLANAMLPTEENARIAAVNEIFSKMPETRGSQMVTKNYNQTGEE